MQEETKVSRIACARKQATLSMFCLSLREPRQSDFAKWSLLHVPSGLLFSDLNLIVYRNCQRGLLSACAVICCLEGFGRGRQIRIEIDVNKAKRALARYSVVLDCSRGRFQIERRVVCKRIA
jgi:hypothetical protein